MFFWKRGALFFVRKIFWWLFFLSKIYTYLHIFHEIFFLLFYTLEQKSKIKKNCILVKLEQMGRYLGCWTNSTKLEWVVTGFLTSLFVLNFSFLNQKWLLVNDLIKLYGNKKFVYISCKPNKIQLPSLNTSTLFRKSTRLSFTLFKKRH